MCFVNLLDVHTSKKHVRMSCILNGGSVIWWFERYNTIVIDDGIIFNFYTGLPHIHIYAVDICSGGFRGGKEGANAPPFGV